MTVTYDGYTMQEAMQKLGISSHAIRRAIRIGKIRRDYVSRTPILNKQDVDGYVPRNYKRGKQ